MTSAPEENETHWSFPLEVIRGGNKTYDAMGFLPVKPSTDHVVLYQIHKNHQGPPMARKGYDTWDHSNVKMPCSNRSTYDVTKKWTMNNSENRWDVIQKALKKKPIQDSQQLAKAILKYNLKFENIWSFQAMHRFFNHHLDPHESQSFFKNTLPKMIALALDLPTLVQAPIPLLKKHKNMSISLTQQQIACLLANAFFCTYPHRNSTGYGSEYANYPKINFTALYENMNSEGIMEKLKCIIHYFKKVTRSTPVGVVTFSRRSVHPRDCPNWERSTAPIGTLPVHVNDGTIEDAHGLIQVDFANKFLGGGVLGSGCVQEEIRFVICPELMVSMLFTEMLDKTEALMIIGCERYSNYQGYGRNSFRFEGDYEDRTPRDSSGRRKTAVLAIDAHSYYEEWDQYNRQMIVRELNKAWVGFSFFSGSDQMNFPGVATGNWGCGAFGGSPQLKSLLQLMACAEARRPMAFYTFHDEQLKREVLRVYSELRKHDVTVGKLFKTIMKYSASKGTSMLHTFLKDELENPTPDYNPENNIASSYRGRSLLNHTEWKPKEESLRQAEETWNQPDDIPNQRQNQWDNGSPFKNEKNDAYASSYPQLGKEMTSGPPCYKEKRNAQKNKATSSHHDDRDRSGSYGNKTESYQTKIYSSSGIVPTHKSKATASNSDHRDRSGSHGHRTVTYQNKTGTHNTNSSNKPPVPPRAYLNEASNVPKSSASDPDLMDVDPPHTSSERSVGLAAQTQNTSRATSIRELARVPTYPKRQRFKIDNTIDLSFYIPNVSVDYLDSQKPNDPDEFSDSNTSESNGSENFTDSSLEVPKASINAVNRNSSDENETYYDSIDDNLVIEEAEEAEEYFDLQFVIPKNDLGSIKPEEPVDNSSTEQSDAKLEESEETNDVYTGKSEDSIDVSVLDKTHISKDVSPKDTETKDSAHESDSDVSKDLNGSEPEKPIISKNSMVENPEKSQDNPDGSFVQKIEVCEDLIMIFQDPWNRNPGEIKCSKDNSILGKSKDIINPSLEKLEDSRDQNIENSENSGETLLIDLNSDNKLVGSNVLQNSEDLYNQSIPKQRVFVPVDLLPINLVDLDDTIKKKSVIVEDHNQSIVKIENLTDTSSEVLIDLNAGTSENYEHSIESIETLKDSTGEVDFDANKTSSIDDPRCAFVWFM